jgi:tRNA threonylcarbamoyladenosine biosynthesis protein TsaB
MPEPPVLLLGIDTCGPAGSVALARLAAGSVELLRETQLAGRTYSATLVAAVGKLLDDAGMRVADLGAIIVVNGPGSFTGVRVGLSAAKGLAEGARIPVAAVSRLEVLSWKAGVEASALDAHRGELFVRVAGYSHAPKELLADKVELAALDPAPQRIAVCDESAASLAGAAWPDVEIVQTAPPTAAEALRLCAPRVVAGEFADLALLDGHYLRRSDAEIFGNPAAPDRQRP